MPKALTVADLEAKLSSFKPVPKECPKCGDRIRGRVTRDFTSTRGRLKGRRRTTLFYLHPSGRECIVRETWPK